MIDGKPVVWYAVLKGTPKDDYAEMYADHGKGEKLAEPRVRPVSVTREEIGNSGYGNDFLNEIQKEIEDIKA